MYHLKLSLIFHMFFHVSSLKITNLFTFSVQKYHCTKDMGFIDGPGIFVSNINETILTINLQIMEVSPKTKLC